MKITKQRLKQIIREELENVLLNDGVKGYIPDEDLDPETGERKDLARKAASDAADAYEDVEVAMGLDPENTSLGPGGTARATARGHTERYIKATGGYSPRRFVPDKDTYEAQNTKNTRGTKVKKAIGALRGRKP